MRQLWLLPILAVAPAIHAETAYVIEQLVVNVNSAPDASGQRVATIKSGEAVEVLDRQGDQVHVHLPNGTEGWVRKSYLSAEEPVQHRLAERTAEVDKLKQDVARLESELATARTGARGGKPGMAQPGVASATAPQTNSLPAGTGAAKGTTNRAAQPGATATNTPQTNSASANTVAAKGAATATSPASEAPAQTNNPESDPAAGEPAYFMTPPEAPARPVWHWALGSFIVALALGYGLGWYMLDRRIRRKFGGLRIY